MNSNVDEQTPGFPVLEDLLSCWLKGCFAKAFPEGGAENAGAVTATGNPAFGDFQCNDAMPLAKTLRIQPRKIAEKIVENASLPGVVKKLEIGRASCRERV